MEETVFESHNILHRNDGADDDDDGADDADDDDDDDDVQ